MLISNTTTAVKASTGFINFSLLFWFCCAVFAKSEQKAQVPGVYGEAGSALFVMGLSTERGFSSASDLIESDQGKILQLKVVAEKIYPSRFQKLWRQGSAINSESAVMQANANNMVKFGELLDFVLQKNDVLRLKRRPLKGVLVELNGEKLGHINDAGFFDLLISAIVGPVPLNVGLKQNILALNKPRRYFSQSGVFELDEGRITSTREMLVTTQAEKELQAERQQSQQKTPSKKGPTLKTSEVHSTRDAESLVVRKESSPKPKSLIEQITMAGKSSAHLKTVSVNNTMLDVPVGNANAAWVDRDLMLEFDEKKQVSQSRRM